MTDAPAPAAVRVLLVDDEPLIRNGFRYVLATDPAIQVVGEVADGAAAIEFVRAHRPDVVLMDVRMPGMAGPEATAIIVEQSSSKVLAMTSIDTEDQLVRMMGAGASGYLLKDESPAHIIEAIRRTALGETVMSSASAAHLVRRVVSDQSVARRDALERVALLTQREREVARGVAAGATNERIGADLHIAAGTVKTHLEQIFAKLGVRNRVQVGIILERAGLGPAGV